MSSKLRVVALAFTLAVTAWSVGVPRSTAVAAELTAAEHGSLAARFRAEANVLRARVHEHETMAARYTEIGGKGDWATHCRNIAGYYRKLAEENEALAAEHESAAKATAKPSP